MRRLSVSYFDTTRDRVPGPGSLTWDSLADWLCSVPEDGRPKMSLPLWSPASYPEGATRRSANVATLSCLVYDLDEVDEDGLVALAGRLAGRAAVVHSTHSHAEGRPKARLVLALSRDALPAEWPALWAAAAAELGLRQDRSCRDLARAYFVPARAPGAPWLALRERGAPLDVDALLAAGPVDRVPPTREVTDPDDLRRALSALRDRTCAGKARRALARSALDALDGAPLAEPGARDRACFDLAEELSRAFPVDPPAAALVEPLRASFDRAALEEPDDPGPTLEDLAAKVERSRAFRAKPVRRAPAVPAPPDPVTDEELAEAEAWLGCPPGRRWVLQHGGRYWTLLRRPWRYSRGMDVRDFVVAGVSALREAGLPVMRLKRDGTLAARDPAEVVRDLGVVADLVLADLGAMRTTWREADRAVVEAPCPCRVVEAERSEAADRWLRALGGERLLDWVSVVRKLDRPAAQLALVGPPGVGKSFLAQCLSRIWVTDGPGTTGSALADFNDGSMRCPLLVADEVVPTDRMGRTRSAEMREAVQARSRPLRRKGRDEARLVGAHRYMVLGNSEAILTPRERGLCADDVAAIAERTLFVRAGAGAGEVLEELGRDGRRELCEGDALARHALWLEAERGDLVDDGRFLVRGDGEEVARRLTVMRPDQSAVCQWLASYLLRPEPVDAAGSGAVLRREGRLLVSARGIYEQWASYSREAQLPSEAIAGVLRTLAPEVAEEGGSRLHVVDMDALADWAEAVDWTTRAALEAAVASDSPDRRSALRIN